MKKILFSLLSGFLFLSGCSSSLRASYELNLDSVETNSLSPKLNDYKLIKKNITLSSKTTGSLPYEDDFINIIWSPDDYSFKFNLLNKTKSTMKVLWDDSIFVFTNNESYKIINGKSKIKDEGRSIQEMLILKGSFIQDSIYPSKWGFSEILPTYIIGNNEKIKRKMLEDYNKQFIKILLPLSIDNKRVDYLFNFKIENLILQDN